MILEKDMLEQELLAEMSERPEVSGGSKTNLNTTAYRIFRILQWLDVQPLSLTELNERFYQEPMIRKRLSSDSVWLYINTLKALGCKIKRPSPSTDYRYVLTHHPFGFLLTQSDPHALARVKQHLAISFSADDMLDFDLLLKKILKRAAFSQSPQEIEYSISEVFHKSRSVDYEDKQSLIGFLKDVIQRTQMLSVGYESPVKGRECLDLLPCGLVYDKGVLYLRGFRPQVPEPVSLRVERVFQAREIQNAPLHAALLEVWHNQPLVVFRLYLDDIRHYEPWHLGEQAEFVESLAGPGNTGSYVRLQLHSRDFFLLRQKLLASGCAFHIEEPSEFREEMLACLQAMSRLYEELADED